MVEFLTDDWQILILILLDLKIRIWPNKKGSTPVDVFVQAVIRTLKSVRYMNLQMHSIHDRQCTYNVTLWHVRTTTVVVEKERVSHILRVVFSLRYPVCKAHVPYCHLWSTRLCSIFPHYLINGTIFEN